MEVKRIEAEHLDDLSANAKTIALAFSIFLSEGEAPPVCNVLPSQVLAFVFLA
jgi:hypothetical protein